MAYSKPGETRKKVFEFVRQRILANSPPTVREVKEAFGFKAVQSAREHLEALVSEGLLVKEPRKARGYHLPAPFGSSTFFIPLLGKVQAGNPRDAIENLEGYISVQSKSPQDRLFGLRVRGHSMSDAGILSGDIAVVRHQQTADSGDVVVALVDGEATIKTLWILNGRVELRPQNATFEPIKPDPERFSILGKVIEVRRFLEAPRFLEHIQE